MAPAESLSSKQEQVLALIAAGSTATAAAQAADVHRNTVANWLHTPEFRGALAAARQAKVALYQDQAEILAAEAIDILRRIIRDDFAPSPLRLKAATALLRYATRFMVAPAEVGAPPQPIVDPLFNDVLFESMHKNAQSDGPESVDPSLPGRAFGHKIGRNEPCPCGSGVKFKRCCIDKPNSLPKVA